MGLFKKIADYRGEAHGVDPTGHDHTKSQIRDFPVNWDANHVIWSPSETQDFTVGEMFEELTGNVSELRTELGGKADVVEFIAEKVGTGSPAVFSGLDEIVEEGVYKGTVEVRTPNHNIYGGVLYVETNVALHIVRQTLVVNDNKFTRTKSITSTSWSAWSRIEETIEIADVEGLEQALNGKAASSHTQAISTITGLQAALDGKQDKIDFGDEDDVILVDKENKIDIWQEMTGKRFRVIYIECQENRAQLQELVSNCLFKTEDGQKELTQGAMVALVVFNTGYKCFAFISPELDL